MPRERKKKDPGKDEKQKGILQDAQNQQSSLSSQEMEKVKQLLQQLGAQTSGSSSQQQSQTESSTPSQTGSFTQPGSSTQNPKKPASTKTNLAFYEQAYSQKLVPESTIAQALALSLTPINRDPPGTLTIQQYELLKPHPDTVYKAGKIAGTVKSSLASVPSSSSLANLTQNQTSLDTPYIQKNNFLNIIQVEPEFFNKNPNTVASKVFPSGYHFRPTEFSKTREYYELILVHSESAQISRKTDPQDKSLVTHSTVHILNVLTPSQWGQDLNKSKFFGIRYIPEGYTYWDYIDAWTNVFWDQNKLFKHTWFIIFKLKPSSSKFPQWFVQWWSTFGPLPEILPPIVMQAFELFKQKFNHGEDPFPVSLHYFSKMSVAWIFSWQYKLSTIEGSKLLPTLQRVFFVRWWAKFQLKNIDCTAVNKWFKNNPNSLCVSEESKFLNQRTRITASIAGTKDKATLMNQLNSMLQILQQQEQASNQMSLPSSSTSEKDEEDEEEEIDLED